MREGISMTAIFQIVIIFIILFAAIMALTINNSNAFGVKDEIINAIESNNGEFFTSANGYLSDEIVQPMKDASYRISGKCPTVESYDLDDVYYGYDRNGKPVGQSERASVCIRKVNVMSKLEEYYDKVFDPYGSRIAKGDFYEGFYYQIVVFYQLDIPIVNQVYDFQTKGETKIFYVHR